MKRSSAIISGIVVAAMLSYGISELAMYALKVRVNNYMDEHGDELKEKIRKRIRERDCELACMEKKGVK